MNAAKRILLSRTALVLDAPFFGSLVLKLQMVEDNTQPTAWTDGTRMGYNAAFVESLTQPELMGVLVHEVMHCALGHPWRIGGREMGKFNEACDLAINPEIRKAGYTLPAGVLDDSKFYGKSAEWIYDRLPAKQEGGSGKPGDGNGGGGFGEVRPAPRTGAGDSPEGDDQPGAGSCAATEEDWKQAVQQAAMAAKQRGKLPANLDRFAKQVAEDRVDWESVLHRFAQQVARNDYSMRRPSRRHLARGVYVPSLYSVECGPMVLVIDTSGSVDGPLLARFGGAIQAIADQVRPSRITVIYADAAVQRIETFERGEPFALNARGGGGTDFRPAFRAVDAMDEEPACLIYLTDMYGSFPDREPEYPVLWAKTTDAKAPFGEEVFINV